MVGAELERALRTFAAAEPPDPLHAVALHGVYREPDRADAELPTY